MSTPKPKRWPHANSQILREQKSPPAPPPEAPQKTAAAMVAPAPINTAPAAAVRPVETAAAVSETRDQAHATRVVKGLLGPVVWDGTLIVRALARTNARLVIGYKKGTDPENPLNLFNVLVRTNLNFMEGMSIPGPHGKLNAINPNTYELQGQCPRWRGRW